MAALSIESNIWTFRTRAGLYRNVREGDDRKADELLAESLREIKAAVVEGGDIKVTDFFSNDISQNLHGQHANGERIGTLQYSSNSGLSWMQRRAGRSRVHASPKADQTEVESGAQGDGPVLETGTLTLKRLVEEAGALDALEQAGAVPVHVLVDLLSASEASTGSPAVDTHSVPIQPDAYIRFRVASAMEFFLQTAHSRLQPKPQICSGSPYFRIHRWSCPRYGQLVRMGRSD